eukprot:530891_1
MILCCKRLNINRVKHIETTTDAPDNTVDRDPLVNDPHEAASSGDVQLEIGVMLCVTCLCALCNIAHSGDHARCRALCNMSLCFFGVEIFAAKESKTSGNELG